MKKNENKLRSEEAAAGRDAMDAPPSRKRTLPGIDDLEKSAPQKKVRFPKGKKVKPGEEVVHAPKDTEDAASEFAIPARKKRKHNVVVLNKVENEEFFDDGGPAEEVYEDNETFIDEGIQIEPFNLTKEKEEGYFDQAGNYVEYINNNEIKDAWLDSVVADPKFEGKSSVVTKIEVETADLSSKEIAQMKRRIADVLEPGETVLRALRRLKGTSNSRKEKMSPETKLLFDQLTEDAMRLMEDGEYNVYDEKREVFLREAEGFEKLAHARGEGTSKDSENLQSASSTVKEFVAGIGDASTTNGADDGDDVDMFAEDDENTPADPASGPTHPESGTSVNDYVFDESSGYYYSSSLGYYYDPSSKLYCNAASGLWYSYNEETGAYDEIPATETNIPATETSNV